MGMVVNPFGFAAAGGGGGTPHRYWRLNVTTNYGNATTLFEEVELREAPGGADVTGSGTASGGGGYTGGAPSAAFDGSTALAYNPSGSSGWLKYDFGLGNDKAIVEVALITGNTTLTALIKNFTLEWSDDDSAWTTQDTCAAYGWLFSDTREFPEAAPAAGFHRFWRIFCETNNGGSSFIALDDVQFRATSGGADQSAVLTTANGGSTGRSIGSTVSTHYKAFDSNVSGGDPYFMSGTTNTYVGYIFPSPVEVQEVLLQCYTNTARAPNIIRIEYSDDEVTWTSQKRITGLTWTSNEQKVLVAI